jgi:hypothetical protein
MIKTLILEDNGFYATKDALQIQQPSLGNEIFILNDESIHDEIEIFYRDVDKVMDKYYNQIDLLIVDIELPDEENNGLVAVKNWITDQDNLNANTLNFGIIVVTNHASTYVEEVLENAANLFGNCFLGYATKGETLGQQLQHLITSTFITPPFVRGGNKYFNTRLLRDKFPKFEKIVSIQNQFIPFYKIIAVQHCKDEVLRLYTTEGILSETAHLDQRPINATNFFKSFCYDAANVGERLEYRVDIDIWEKDQEESTERVKEEGKKRISDSIQALLPVFVCVGRYFAINPLFLAGVNDVRPNLHEIKHYLQTYNLNYVKDVSVVDPEDDIRGNININYGNGKNSYVPIYGRTLQTGITKNERRVINTYHDRLFLFRELTSERWKPLLTQLKLHYSQF